MTDYHINFALNDGRSIDAFAAGSSAAGKNLPVEKLGDAVAGSPDSFSLANDRIITDVFFGCATGAVELIRDGENTGVIFRADQNQATQAGRKKHAVGLAKNVVYRIKVVTPIPA